MHDQRGIRKMCVLVNIREQTVPDMYIMQNIGSHRALMRVQRALHGTYLSYIAMLNLPTPIHTNEIQNLFTFL